MSEDSDPTADDPSERFIDHFEPVLCETNEDREMLARLAEQVREFENDDGELTLTIDGTYDPETVFCWAPFDGDVDESVPDSVATLADHHNGIEWESAGGGILGFPGLMDDGDLSAFFWDPIYLDHSGNEEYSEALSDEGLDFDDVREAFSVGQNWIVFDPLAENAKGEPRRAFVSHGMCELEEIPGIEDCGAGQALLRLMAEYFLDEDALDPVYA